MLDFNSLLKQESETHFSVRYDARGHRRFYRKTQEGRLIVPSIAQIAKYARRTYPYLTNDQEDLQLRFLPSLPLEDQMIIQEILSPFSLH